MNFLTKNTPAQETLPIGALNLKNISLYTYRNLFLVSNLPLIGKKAFYRSETTQRK